MKSAILINPSYSRPFDVHRYSDHSEIGNLVEAIWIANFSDRHCAISRKGGAKPKSDYKQQLKVLILDLYVAWKTDPGLSIGVHLSNTAWHTGSRYNALHLSRQIPKLVHQLAAKGLIHLSPGSYAGPGVATNRTARIMSAEPLRVHFREARFGLQHIHAFEGKEVIIMHDSSKSGKDVEYEDTPATVAMRNNLKGYNRLLARTFIDIPDRVEPFLERPIKRGPRQGEMTRVPICTLDNQVRRIFNRSDWTSGGRFFGGWWQGVGSELRKRIHINGQPTVEVDYQALHIAILSATHGKDITGDPYELAEGLVPGINAREQRKLVKVLVLMALNAKDRVTACQAFRQDCATGSIGKSMKNVELLALLDAFADKHPHLKGELCADKGISLMYTDSQLAEHVIYLFAHRGIPVLCVHDSFIIDYRYGGWLKRVMAQATKSIIGREVATSHNYLGRDETEKMSPDYLDDYVAFRHRVVCPASETRRRLFELRPVFRTFCLLTLRGHFPSHIFESLFWRFVADA
jgi:hypothetical protein